VDVWVDLARTVSAAVTFAEWRIRNIEQTLRARGPHASTDDIG
jgi:hypothetical protein